MSEFAASGVLFVACSLLRERFPRPSRKQPPKFLPEKQFSSEKLTPIDIVYSHRGPAIASDEINKTARRG